MTEEQRGFLDSVWRRGYVYSTLAEARARFRRVREEAMGRWHRDLGAYALLTGVDRGTLGVPTVIVTSFTAIPEDMEGALINILAPGARSCEMPDDLMLTICARRVRQIRNEQLSGHQRSRQMPSGLYQYADSPETPMIVLPDGRDEPAPEWLLRMAGLA